MTVHEPATMPQVWTCSFHGRAGASARAIFSTRVQAAAFAERHAAQAGEPIEWLEEPDGSWFLSTSHGGYRVEPDLA